MKLRTSASLALLVLAACSEGKFGGAGAGKGKGESERSSGEADGNPLGQVEDDGDLETDKSDEPAMVAGAFLTCVEDPALPGSSTAYPGVGCTLKDRDGVKLSFSQLTGRLWTLLDSYNQDLRGAFQDADDASPYHVTVLVDRAYLRFHKVRLEVARGEATSSYVSFIVPSGPAPDAGDDTPPPAVPPPQLKDFGLNGDFRLGDGRFSEGWNRGCLQELQRVELSGKRMTIGFNVEGGDALIGISLDEMCGVSVKSNYVYIYRGNTKVYEGNIPVEARGVAVPGFKAQPGRYTLVIRSLYNKSTKDYDDFVVGRVGFSYQGTIRFEEPVAGED